MKKPILLSAAAGLVCASLAAHAEPPKAANGMFVDASGMTLYTFDKDTKGGPSACTGGCAQAWPAAKASDSDKASGEWTIVDAEGGGKQWAYDGKRLYRFGKDQKPGDKNGDNFRDVWHVAKPS
jgi:predicted lipoprotein with Yx(FWY)xxD motif